MHNLLSLTGLSVIFIDVANQITMSTDGLRSWRVAVDGDRAIM